MGSVAGWGLRIGDGVYTRMGTQDRCRGQWQDGDPGQVQRSMAGWGPRTGVGVWQDGDPGQVPGFINLADLCCLFLPAQHLSSFAQCVLTVY